MTDGPHVTLHTDKNSLIIPVDRERLGDFIGGLLGRPQTIEDSFDGPFDLDKSNLENVFYLVHQRVKQQNKAELVQFSINIQYSDESSVLLNSLDDFQHYREVRPQVSIAAELAWIYLIQFEDEPIPERQVVELRITARGSERSSLDPILWLVRQRLLGLHKTFTVRIQHTARSWGVDIEHLLTGQIRSRIKNEHWFKRSIYNNAGWLGLTAGSLFLLLVALGLYTALQPTRNAFLAQGQTVLSKVVEEKADFLVKSVIDNPFIQQQDTIGIIMIPVVVLALLIGGAVTVFAYNPPKSYLVLSDAAKNDREESLEKRKRNWKYLLASGVTATIAGVLSRYLFLKLFGQVGP